MKAISCLLSLSLLSAAGPAEVTLFSFDDHSIPFKKNLSVTMAQAKKFEGNPVVRRGPAGAPDSYRAQFYGTVLRIDGKFRMWYAACSYDPAKGGKEWANNPDYDDTWRVAYAESADGIHWTKPDLGLSDFRGSRHNNLVEFPDSIDLGLLNPLASFVIYEPDDPDPSRRYKMALYGKYYNSDPTKERKTPATIYPFWSADGLRWKLAGRPPKEKAYNEKEAPFTVERVFEIGGLYRFDGIYYVTGQQMPPDTTLPNGEPTGRTLVTHWSGDFVHWTEESSFSFQRYGYRPAKVGSVEEAHEGASIWNRGNVLLGTYGLWHGAAERRDLRLDLGLVVSNDGVHFREPVADHVFIERGPEGAWDQHGVLQGQGFLNVGDQTYIYYGGWDPSLGQIVPGEIGLATLPRDRLGYLSTRVAGEGSLITAVLHRPAPGAALSVNADGLGGGSQLRIELVNKLGQPLPGFSGASAAQFDQPGLDQKVIWPRSGRTTLPAEPFRVRIRWQGAELGRIRLYAMYLR